MEEFTYKTAKLIAKKLFGTTADDEKDQAADDTSANPSDEVITNVTTDSETGTENIIPNAEEGNDDGTKNDETDENEFEILEKQKPSDVIDKADDENIGKNSEIFKFLFCSTRRCL